MEWIITTPEMSHSGVRNMRWGIRKYQNKDGSWTELGKRRRREMSPDAKKRASRKNEAKNLKSKGELDTAKANLKITKAQNKAAVQEAKAGVKTLRGKMADKAKAAAVAVKDAAKAKVEERKAAKKEATAEEIIRSGDMKKILQNKDKLTNEQLKAAADRMDLEQRLSGIDAKKKQDAVAAYKRVADVVGTTANLTSNGIVVYNNLSKILATAGITELPLVTATAGRGGSSQSQSSSSSANSSSGSQSQSSQSGPSHSSGSQSQSSSSSTNSSQQSSSSNSSSSSHIPTQTNHPSNAATGSGSSSSGNHIPTQSTHQPYHGSYVPTQIHANNPSGHHATASSIGGASAATHARSQRLTNALATARAKYGANSDEVKELKKARDASRRVEDLVKFAENNESSSVLTAEQKEANRRYIENKRHLERAQGTFSMLNNADAIANRLLDD
jgi:muconolactone delta-isomerase